MAQFLRFSVPSLFGAFFFLFPVAYDGVYTIPIAVMTELTNDLLGSEFIVRAAIGIVFLSASLSLYYSIFSKNDSADESGIREIFVVGPAWLALRGIGFVLICMIYWQLGPEFIWGDSTGHIVVFDLIVAIATIFIFAAFLMPLLTDFGLMELVGIVFSRVFQRLFRLPGRSCVDAVASWMAAAPVGVLITTQQFERGNYSAREAATIATNFSIVSLPFCVVVAKFAGLGHLFLQYYFTVCLAGFIAAIVMPRIPPLSRIPDYYSAAGRQLNESVSARGRGLLRVGYDAALAKAANAPSFSQYIITGTRNLFDIWFGLMPPLVAIATLGLVLAETTPILQYLSLPFVPILELFQLPEAEAAAPALLAGFAEMFLPAVIAADIESDLTRFVVISVSITQLIYMSEIGVMIIKSKIPLGFIELAVIFLLRTLITLPIIVVCAYAFVD